MSKKLVIGIIWSTVEILIKRVLDLVVRLVLARVLFPEDFGLVGMAMVFTTFLLILNEGGMGTALIQRKASELSKVHFNTVFWTSIGWTLVLYSVIYFVVSPFVAWFYETPQLVAIVRVLSVSILFGALNTVHLAQLMKAMEFKKIAFVKNISTLVAGIAAVLMALLGMGVWALVGYTVLASFVAIPLYYRTTRWLPTFSWDRQAFKEIFGFGMYTTGTKLTKNLASNADYLLIGKFVSASTLGVYTLAFMLTNSVKTQVAAMLNRVVFPLYSSMQDNRLKMKSYYLKLIRYYAMVLYPMMLMIILLGDDIIPFIFGEKWRQAVLPAKILAGAMLINILISGYKILIRSIGRPKLELKIELFTSYFIYIPAVTVGLTLNGIIGVAWAIFVVQNIQLFIATYFLKKLFNIRFFDVIKSISPVLLSSLVMMVLGFAIWYFAVNWMWGVLLLLLSYFLVLLPIIKNELLTVYHKIKTQ